MGNARLLIVDDEEEIREMLARHFRLMDFDIDTAENGIKALSILNDKRIEVVISDIKMPKMDGVEMLRIIRDEYPMVRVIMITGYVTLDNALACMRRRADACIFKPLNDLTELDQAVDLSLGILKHWQEKLHDLQGLSKLPEVHRA